MDYSTQIQPAGMKCYICGKANERLILVDGQPFCPDCRVRYAPEADVKAEMNEKSGQLIECVNPAHLYFGSIHYIQPDCVAAKADVFTKFGQQFTKAIAINLDREITGADSDESWQASEALLKR